MSQKQPRRKKQAPDVSTLGAELALAIVLGIAGLSYRYGHVQGELEALRPERSPETVTAPAPPPNPVAQPIPPRTAARTRDRSLERLRARVEALERLQVQRSTTRARRARDGAAIVSRLPNRAAALGASRPSTLDVGSRTLDVGRRGLTVGSRTLKLANRTFNRGWRPETRSVGRPAAPHPVDRVIVEHTGTVRANPCPAGEKLISATCLPEDSIILGQVPVQVEIVNPRRRRTVLEQIIEAGRRLNRNRRPERAAPRRPEPRPGAYRSLGLKVPPAGRVMHR